MTGGPGASHLAVLARMAVIDVARRPWRLAFLAAGIALAGATSFGALVFHAAIGGALERSMARLGADAAVLPAGVTPNLTPALLTVEPSNRSLPAGAMAALAAMPAVQAVAPQRTLQLADAAGHLPFDVIVFDRAADLTVQPWVVERLERPFSRGDVIVGGRRPEAVGERTVIQGEPIVVHGRLGLAGAGPFERAMFMAPDTARRLADAGATLADGSPFPQDPLASPSGALVRLRPGGGPEALRFAAASVDGVTVVTGSGSQVQVRQSVAALAGGSRATLFLALVAPAVLVGVAYTGMLAERRRELGTMRAIGVSRGAVIVTVAVESAIAAGTGAVAGIAVSAAVIAGFLRTVGFELEQRSIDLVLPPIAECAAYAAVSGAAAVSTAMLGAMAAAFIAARREPWALLRGES